MLCIHKFLGVMSSHALVSGRPFCKTLSHVHHVCDVYVNLVLKKEKYILGRIGLNFGGFGEQLN